MGLFRKSPKAGAADPAPVADEDRRSNDDREDNVEDLAQVNTTATEDIVYPTGLKLALLLVSVFISMFLVALVCPTSTYPPTRLPTCLPWVYPTLATRQMR